MDKFVRVYSGGELVKGPNGVEFGNLPEEGIWFEKAPTFDDLIDAAHKKLGWSPGTHSIHVRGRMNVGGGAHRHFIMVPINDDMSWSSYVKAVFNGTEWNCLEIYVQAERRPSAEAISSELVMAIEPADVLYQNARPLMATVNRPNEHSPCAQLQKPRRSTRTCANNGGRVVDAEVRCGQDENGASETVDTTSYPLIGLYDTDHHARALASGQHLTELNPRTREPLRFEKRYERYLRPAGLMGLVSILVLCEKKGVQLDNPRDTCIEFEAADGSRGAQMFFEASEIKVVKLVPGTTIILLTTLEHEEGSKALNVCIWHSLEQQGSAPPLQPAGIAAANSPSSDVSQDKPMAMEEMIEEFMEKAAWLDDGACVSFRLHDVASRAQSLKAIPA